MTKSLHIIILEDIPADAELIQFELTQAGISFEAKWTQDKKSYLKALDAFHPDLILSDYSLPSFDGLSALRLAGQKCPEVPFIFVSGALGEEKAIELLKKGAMDYVLKDRLSRLGPVVERALHEAKMLTDRRIAEEERRAAQEALAKSEALYRNLFENSFIGMFQSSLDGRILLVNKAFASMWGYESPQEMIFSISETGNQIHISNEKLKKLISIFEQQQWLQTEESFLRKDGSLMIGRVAGRRVYRLDGTAYLDGLIEDITEQKQSEERLKKYADEVADLYNNAPCGYHSLAEDGTIVSMNDTELNWLGYSRNEVIGKMKMEELLPLEDKEKFQESFRDLKEYGVVLDFDSKMIRKDKRGFPVIINATAIYDKNNRFIMSRASVFDNSKRKKAEEDLIKSEKELQRKTKKLKELNSALKNLVDSITEEEVKKNKGKLIH